MPSRKQTDAENRRRTRSKDRRRSPSITGGFLTAAVIRSNVLQGEFDRVEPDAGPVVTAVQLQADLDSTRVSERGEIEFL